MKVSSISVNTNLQNTAKNTIHSKQNSKNNSSEPAFKGAYLGTLKESEIKSLFFDSKELLNITRKALPALQEKFNSFFDATLNIYPDVTRTINIHVTKTPGETEALKEYIVKNNHKFNFPQRLIDDFKLGKNSLHDGWLDETCYTPFGLHLDQLGEQASLKRIMDFIKDINDDKIISDIYKMRNHDYKVSKKIPSYYWEFPGG